jgi:hypothetical protein
MSVRIVQCYWSNSNMQTNIIYINGSPLSEWKITHYAAFNEI